MNSRSFKDNFNAYFLNTLLCCRHYHISFYGSAQRFQHVDKLLRDVTHTVIQCNKVWRFQLWASYDAWEMENATNAEMIRPLRRGLWFVRDRDYNAYDTLAVVDNLQRNSRKETFCPRRKLSANQAPAGPPGSGSRQQAHEKGPAPDVGTNQEVKDMKQVCRMDKTNKRPYCLRKPCSYRLDGTCSGPVVAVKDYYSFYTCPQDADPGEHVNCGQYAECAYCRDRNNIPHD